MAKFKITNTEKKASRLGVIVHENGAQKQVLKPGQSAEVEVKRAAIITLTETEL
jgi:hypothetical protein